MTISHGTVDWGRDGTDTPATTTFGDILRRHRLGSALSQEALAERAGLSPDAIRALERGRRGAPRPDTIARLVDALGLEAADRAELIAAAQGTAPAAPTAVADRATPPDRSVREQQLPTGSFLGSLPVEPLVARGEELASIAPALAAAAAGEGRTVLLAGEPGVGKTRLAQEVTLEAHRQGFLVTAGTCFEGEQAVPYFPFLDAFAGAYAAAPAQLRASAASRWPYLGALLPNHLPVPEVSGGSDEQQRVLFSGAAFLDALSAQAPVALLIDDLHWADSASLRLLRYLAQHGRTSRLLLIGTYRDVAIRTGHPLHTAASELHRADLAITVHLRRLDRSETAQLVSSLAGGHLAPEDFTDLIHARTEGNPFFVQQVVRTLAERGDISWQDGDWLRTSVEQVKVPESVRSVIAQRVARLGPASQEVLREASVLGHTFHFDDLAAMTQYGEAQLEEGLDEAEVIRLVRETGRGIYAFDHGLTQQALYHELSSRRRRRLHRAAAEAIETLPAPRQDRRAAEIARHFLEGDVPERAIPYALRAGDQAEAVFAHTEAEAHYRIALRLAQEISDERLRTQALEKLGAPLHRSGQYAEALKVLEQAAEAYERENNLEALLPVIAEIGGVCANQGAPQEGLNRMAPLIPRLESLPPSPNLIFLYASYGSLLFVLGRREDHLAIAQRSSDLADRLGDVPALAVARAQLGLALLSLRRRAEGLVVLEEAIALSEQAGDLATLGHALNNAAYVAELRGDFERSIGLFERGLELSRRVGNQAQAAFMATALARNHLLAGDRPRSREYIEEALDTARELGPSWVAPYPVLGLARLLIAEGDLDAAETSLQDGLALAGANSDRQASGTAQQLLAEVDLLRDAPEKALQHLRDAGIREDWDPDRDDTSLAAALVMARVLAALGRTPEAQRIVQLVIERGTQAGELLVVERAHQVDARLRNP